MAKFKADNFAGIALSEDSRTITTTFTDEHGEVLNLGFPIDQMEALLIQSLQLTAKAHQELSGIERERFVIEAQGGGVAATELGEFALILLIQGVEIAFELHRDVLVALSKRALEIAR